MAFATTDDVATRLGRPLTEDETAMAEQVIALVTEEIWSVLDEDSDWAEALNPVPELFKDLCVRKVIAVGANPNGLAAESKTIGAHTQARTFSQPEYGASSLTSYERREIRRVVGRGSFSARTLESPYSGSDSSDLDFAEL